jgi:adenylate kinase family enzyme
MKRKVIMFQGISGCGKGTQVAKVKTFLDEETNTNTYIMEAGNGFRSFLSNKSYLAECASNITKNGGFQPIFMSVWNWTNTIINGLKKEESIIFDGTPRQKDEPVILDELWEYVGHTDKVYVIYQKISDNEARRRLKSRGRHDDHDEAIEKRIEGFKQHVLPVIEWYKKHDRYIVLEIDGSGSIEEVFEDIIKGLATDPNRISG